jgi:GDP-4-dehydro-6-deoxy-D-mannose reductase
VPFEGDVRSPEEVLAAVRDSSPSAVIHLAAISSVGESWQRSAETWNVNAVGTVNVIDALVAAVPRARLLFVSTGEVYGRAAETPTSESAPFAPLSPYAASKVAAEIAAGQAARSAGLDVVVARAFQHEGPGRGDSFAIGSWTRQIAELERRGGGELLVGDLSPERDITDVRDVCRAYELLLDPAVEGGTYNVASGAKVALEEVVEMLVNLAQAPISVATDESRFRPSDIPVVWGDSAKLRAATGWAPEIQLRQTVADALDYAREVVDKESVTKA